MLLHDGPLTSQPQEAVEVDWGNPLAAGLVGFINAAAPPITPGETYLSYLHRPSELGFAHVSDDTGGLQTQRTSRPVVSAATLLHVGTIKNYDSSPRFAAAIGTYADSNVGFGFQCGDTDTPPRGFLRAQNGEGVTSAEILGVSGNNQSLPDVAVWVLVYDGTFAMRIYRNGQNVTASNGSQGAIGALEQMDALTMGGLRRGASLPSSPGNESYLVAAWDRALSAAEIQHLSANPWQLFRVRQVWLPASAAPSADVAGSVALSLTATGSIAVAKPVSGNVAVALATSGSLAVAKPVAGGVGLALSATGAIAVNKPVAGSVAMGVACSGALTVPKPVAGSVAVGLTAAGSVAVAKPVSGAVAVALTTSGALTTVGMGGAVAVSVATAGSVAVAKPVSGAVLVSLTTAAALTVAKPVGGAVVLSLTTTGRIETATLRGLVTAVLTLRSTPTTLTLRPTDATLTTRAGAAALTLRPASDAALQFQTDDPV